MGVYHIVLFRLKPNHERSLFEYWKNQVHGLVGVVPGLKHVDVGAPLPATADRAKGFNVSLVAILEKSDDAQIYAEHPEHERNAVLNYLKRSWFATWNFKSDEETELCSSARAGYQSLFRSRCNATVFLNEKIQRQQSTTPVDL